MVEMPVPIRGRKPQEDGFMLVAVMFLLVLLVLSLAIAAPRVAKSIQRDREVETMHRGKQYVRAIQLYYRKFGAYPPSIDALVNTNNLRFLRKKYIDPMTGKDDWKPILFGQNKAPLAMGFFGQPLAGGATPIAGIGPGGAGGMQNPGGIGGMPGAAGFGGPTGGGSSSIVGGGLNSGGSSSPTDSSLFGSADTGAGNQAGQAAATGGTDANGNPIGTPGGTGSSAGPGNTGPGTGTGFMSGQTGQSFGGAGVIGVEPALQKQSILVYKKKNHYNEWEFTYSPLSEMKQIAGGNLGIGQPASNLNGQSGTGGSNSTFGGSNNTFGGSNSTFGGASSGNSGPNFAPQQPQQ